MEVIKKILNSRKFLLAILTAIFLVLEEVTGFKIDEATMDRVVQVIIAVIAGESLIDVFRNFKKPVS